jgi:hypothetical protein
MKKYRRKETVLVWQWTGDKSIVDEINESMDSYNVKIHPDCNLKAGIDNDVVYLSHKRGTHTSSSFVYLNDYIVFDPNDEDLPLACYNESWLNKNYVEL